MNQKLSIDEIDALEQVSTNGRAARPSACVARNSKRLIGIKLMSHRRDGGFELTENGRQVLFIQQCIRALKALSDPQTSADPIDQAVTGFLGKKGHIQRNAETNAWELSQRGQECLTDILANDLNVL
jgi:hypothetical protein